MSENKSWFFFFLRLTDQEKWKDTKYQGTALGILQIQVSKCYVQLCATRVKQLMWHGQVARKTWSTSAHLGRDNLGGPCLLTSMNS